MPPRARVREGGELGLLDDALAGHEQHEAARRRSRAPRRRPRSSRRPASCTRFTTALPLPCGPDVGDLVDLQPVDAAAVGEDQDVGVRRGDEEVARRSPRPCVFIPTRPAAAAPLRAVGRDRGALDVAGVGDRDRHVLVGDQVLDRDLVGGVDDLGAARVAVVVADLPQLVADDLVDARRARRGCPCRSAMRSDELRELVHDLLALEAGEPLQLQLEDRVGLDLAEARSARRRPGFALSGVRRRRGSARSPRRGGRGRSRSPRGCGRAPRPCAARRPCAGAPPRGGSR